MKEHLAPYFKAIAAFLAPAAGAVIIAVTPDSPGGSSITSGEWIAALALAVFTSGSVYAAPRNRYLSPQVK